MHYKKADRKQANDRACRTHKKAGQTTEQDTQATKQARDKKEALAAVRSCKDNRQAGLAGRREIW
jgi:hypothetical protein